MTLCPGRRNGGYLSLELAVAVGLLMYLLATFAASASHELRLAKANYWRAIAIEVVDGEMEAILAGEWRAYTEGTREYKVQADAAKNLPDGRFVLTRRARRLKLEWLPARPGKGGRVIREIMLP